jgi:hypothetical protein
MSLCESLSFLTRPCMMKYRIRGGENGKEEEENREEEMEVEGEGQQNNSYLRLCIAFEGYAYVVDRSRYQLNSVIPSLLLILPFLPLPSVPLLPTLHSSCQLDYIVRHICNQVLQLLVDNLHICKHASLSLQLSFHAADCIVNPVSCDMYPSMHACPNSVSLAISPCLESDTYTYTYYTVFLHCYCIS